jgi:hypothetical protein
MISLTAAEVDILNISILYEINYQHRYSLVRKSYCLAKMENKYCWRCKIAVPFLDEGGVQINPQSIRKMNDIRERKSFQPN